MSTMVITEASTVRRPDCGYRRPVTLPVAAATTTATAATTATSTAATTTTVIVGP